MRLGLLGGTFDPIHRGHLVTAQSVRQQLDMDEVWFLPTGLPWMKRGAPLSAARHRQAMVELAVGGYEGFAVSTIELERPGETYTVDTLEHLRAQRDAEDELFFIMGADTLEGFHRWKEPGRILELATVVVASRPGYGETGPQELERALPGARERIVMVRTPLVEVSGSELRQRVAQGLSIRGLLPDSVAEYVEAHGLYREGAKT